MIPVVKTILIPLLVAVVFYSSTAMVFASENPLSRPNNKVGVHILFTSELKNARLLINSNGGDWGYVTIPIQIKDLDIAKWQQFMDDAKLYHIIPIIRLTTEADVNNPGSWRTPTNTDILNFAYFLNSLQWPIKNRYVIVFNEVNRANEWGDIPNPASYAGILNYAASVFKSINSDFFIISAGLDNAASNISGHYINEYSFLNRMYQAVPEVFNQIDGFSSHSYPNPNFSQPETKQDQESIASFRFEKDLIKQLSGKDLPVFISETGWSRATTPANKLYDYYKDAFSSVWNDSSIVAVTPFLLDASTQPFLEFSLENGQTANDSYKAIADLLKVKGEPLIPSPSPTLIPTIIQTPVKSVLGENIKKTKSMVDTFIAWIKNL